MRGLDVFRSVAIVFVAGGLISVGAEWWRGAGKLASAAVALTEVASLLLEEPGEVEASVGESEEPRLTSPPPNGLCHVPEAPLHERGPKKFFRSTEDVPAKVRAVKFPRAPFALMPRRVTLYERPRFIICETPVSIHERPAPEQVVVGIPGEEPSPGGNAFGR